LYFGNESLPFLDLNCKFEITNYKLRMTSTLDKLRAILWRDLLTAIRHRSGSSLPWSESSPNWRLFIFSPAPSAPVFAPAASNISLS